MTHLTLGLSNTLTLNFSNLKYQLQLTEMQKDRLDVYFQWRD